MEKVTIIKNKDTTCPHDRYPLTFKECNLMYFDNKKKKNRKVEGTISVKLLYCEKCGWYCANHRILSEIDKQVSLKKVIHTPYSSIDAINRYRELENKEKINSSHPASQPRVE